MLVIGITSYDRCGKDTFALDLKEAYKKQNKKVIILRMADSLKNVVSEMLGINKATLESMKNDDKLLGWGLNIEPTRNILIKTGTALRNVFGEKIFVDNVKDKILKFYNDKDTVIIIPDIRFKIEAEMIKELNGVIIRLFSELKSCGANNEKYEVDEIKYDYDFRIIPNDKIKLDLKEMKL